MLHNIEETFEPESSSEISQYVQSVPKFRLSLVDSSQSKNISSIELGSQDPASQKDKNYFNNKFEEARKSVKVSLDISQMINQKSEPVKVKLDLSQKISQPSGLLKLEKLQMDSSPEQSLKKSQSISTIKQDKQNFLEQMQLLDDKITQESGFQFTFSPEREKNDQSGLIKTKDNIDDIDKPFVKRASILDIFQQPQQKPFQATRLQGISLNFTPPSQQKTQSKLQSLSAGKITDKKIPVKNLIQDYDKYVAESMILDEKDSRHIQLEQNNNQQIEDSNQLDGIQQEKHNFQNDIYSVNNIKQQNKTKVQTFQSNLMQVNSFKDLLKKVVKKDEDHICLNDIDKQSDQKPQQSNEKVNLEQELVVEQTFQSPTKTNTSIQQLDSGKKLNLGSWINNIVMRKDEIKNDDCQEKIQEQANLSQKSLQEQILERLQNMENNQDVIVEKIDYDQNQNSQQKNNIDFNGEVEQIDQQKNIEINQIEEETQKSDIKKYPNNQFYSDKKKLNSNDEQLSDQIQQQYQNIDQISSARNIIQFSDAKEKQNNYENENEFLDDYQNSQEQWQKSSTKIHYDNRYDSDQKQEKNELNQEYNAFNRILPSKQEFLEQHKQEKFDNYSIYQKQKNVAEKMYSDVSKDKMLQDPLTRTLFDDYKPKLNYNYNKTTSQHSGINISDIRQNILQKVNEQTIQSQRQDTIPSQFIDRSHYSERLVQSERLPDNQPDNYDLYLKMAETNSSREAEPKLTDSARRRKYADEKYKQQIYSMEVELECNHLIEEGKIVQALHVMTPIFQKFEKMNSKQADLKAKLFQIRLCYLIANCQFKCEDTTECIKYCDKGLTQINFFTDEQIYTDLKYFSVHFQKMLGDINFSKNNYDDCIFHFNAIISINQQCQSYQKTRKGKQQNQEQILSDDKILYPIALSYYKLGRFQDSLKFFLKLEKYFESRQALSQLITIYSKVSEIGLKLGNLQLAMQYSEEAIDVIERTQEFQQKFQEISSIFYDQIGLIHYQQKNYKHSCQSYVKSLIIKQQIHGHMSPSLINVYLTVGKLQTELKQYDESEINFKKANEIIEQIYGVNSIYSAKTFVHIAQVKIAMKNKAEALFNYKLAFNIYVNQLGEQHVNVYTVLVNIISLCLDLNQFKESQYYTQIALENISKNIMLSNIIYLNEISNVYKNHKKYHESIKLYTETIKQYKSFEKTEDQVKYFKHLPLIYCNLASSFHNIQKFDLGVQNYRNALEINQKLNGNDHIFNANIFEGMANLYKDLQKPRDVEFYQKKAAQIIKINY